jgi:hypothetical protein
MITRRTPITGNGFAKGLRFIESISAAIAQGGARRAWRTSAVHADGSRFARNRVNTAREIFFRDKRKGRREDG